MNAFRNLKRNTFVILLLFCGAFLCAEFSGNFRISEYNWIYRWGIFCNYLLHYFSILFSAFNIILILSSKSYLKEKLLLAVFSLIPLIFFAYIMIQ